MQLLLLVDPVLLTTELLLTLELELGEADLAVLKLLELLFSELD